jgi:hypothetical protein
VSKKLTDVSEMFNAIALMMEAVNSSKATVNIGDTTRRNISKADLFILSAVRT